MSGHLASDIQLLRDKARVSMGAPWDSHTLWQPLSCALLSSLTLTYEVSHLVEIASV